MIIIWIEVIIFLIEYIFNKKFRKEISKREHNDINSDYPYGPSVASL